MLILSCWILTLLKTVSCPLCSQVFLVKPLSLNNSSWQLTASIGYAIWVLTVIFYHFMCNYMYWCSWLSPVLFLLSGNICMLQDTLVFRICAQFYFVLSGDICMLHQFMTFCVKTAHFYYFLSGDICVLYFSLLLICRNWWVDIFWVGTDHWTNLGDYC